MTSWSHYWRTDTVDKSEQERAESGSDSLDALSSNLFAVAGVEPGDSVYAISQARGQLRILGRVVVAELVDTPTARVRLGREPWNASDHVLAAPHGGTGIRFDAVVPSERLRDIEFVTRSGTVGPKFTAPNVPDRQTFRGVRRITEATAALFDAVLGA